MSTEKFSQQYHIILHIPGRSNNVCLSYFCLILLIKYHLSLCSKVIFWFGATNCTKPYFWIFVGFFMQMKFFFAWFINLIRAGYNTTKIQLFLKGNKFFSSKMWFFGCSREYLKTKKILKKSVTNLFLCSQIHPLIYFDH